MIKNVKYKCISCNKGTGVLIGITLGDIIGDKKVQHFYIHNAQTPCWKKYMNDNKAILYQSPAFTIWDDVDLMRKEIEAYEK